MVYDLPLNHRHKKKATASARPLREGPRLRATAHRGGPAHGTIYVRPFGRAQHLLPCWKLLAEGGSGDGRGVAR